jgi:hypothetical protein
MESIRSRTDARRKAAQLVTVANTFGAAAESWYTFNVPRWAPRRPAAMKPTGSEPKPTRAIYAFSARL